MLKESGDKWRKNIEKMAGVEVKSEQMDGQSGEELGYQEEPKIETSDWKLPEGEDDEDRDQNYLKKKMMTMMMHHARPKVRVGLYGGLGPMLGLDCQMLMMMHHGC